MEKGALKLIQAGEATDASFTTFYGYSVWEPGQLEREVTRGSWFMASASSQIIWNALQKLKETETKNPQSAGISMWESLIEKIGHDEDQLESKKNDSFSDLMLKSWATEMLCTENEGDVENDDGSSSLNIDNDMIQQALAVANADPVTVGSLVQATTDEINPPFLLYDQYLHKSTLLFFQDSEKASFGLVLNLPTFESYELKTPLGKRFNFTVRYGGPSGSTGTNKDDIDDVEEPLIWLHCSMGLKDLHVGAPIGSGNGMGVGSVWSCTAEQVGQALDTGFAFPEEFLVVKGFVVWDKEIEGSGGLAGQLRSSNFKPVNATSVDSVWSTLLRQDTIENQTSVELNFEKVLDAWTHGSQNNEEDIDTDTTASTGKAEESFVYGSNTTVSSLADESLLHWMEIFLLGGAVYYPFQ